MSKKITIINRENEKSSRYKVSYPNRFGGGTSVVYSPSVSDMKGFLGYCFANGLTPVKLECNPKYVSRKIKR